MAKGLGRVEPWRGRWRVFLPGVGRIYTDRGRQIRSREHAESVLAAFRRYAMDHGHELAAEEFKPPRRAEHTVARWADRLLEDLRRRVARMERSPTYLAEVERWRAQHWGPLLGRTVFEVETLHVVELARQLEDRGVGSNTVAKVLGGLHRVLVYAEEHMPRRLGYRVPRFPRRERTRYTPNIPPVEVRDRILARVPIERRGIFLAMRLAVRPGEARAFNRTEYDRARRHLEIRWAMQGQSHSARRGPTKEGTVRVLEVDDELAAWIEAHVPTEGRLDMPLFVHPEARRRKGATSRWTMSSLEYEWRRACEAEGVVGLRLYTAMKHATLSHVVRAGGTLLEAQAIAGHADPRSTRLYAHLEPVVPAVRLRLPTGPRS